MTALTERLGTRSLRSVLQRSATRAAALSMLRGVVPLGFLVVAVLIGRFLHAGQLGQYAGVSALAQIVIWGFSGGFPMMALRDLVAERASPAYLSRLLQLQFSLSFIAVPLVGGLAGLLARDPSIIPLGLLAGISFTMFNALYVASAAHSARRSYIISGLGEALGGTALMAFTIVALVLDEGVTGALLASALAWGLAFALLVVLFQPSQCELVPEGRRQLLKRSLPYLAYGLSSGSYARIDVALLRVLAGPVTTGIYTAAYRLLGPFNLLASAFAFVLLGQLPVHGVAWSTEWIAAFRRAQRRFALVMTLLAVVALIMTPLAISILFGDEYRAASTAARILIFSVIPFAWYWPIIHALNTADQTRDVVLLLAASIVTDVIGVVVLGTHLGAVGAAIAWLIAESMLLVLAELRFRALAAAGATHLANGGTA